MRSQTDKMKKAKILIYDLEVSPILGWTYSLWDARVIKVERQAFIMSVSYRWYGEKKIHHESLAGNPSLGYDDCDKGLVRIIRDLFDDADIVVAHNANRFDNKVATAAFLRHDLTPPSPYKTVDTLRVARGISKFPSNSLDSLCETFGIGRKSTTTHRELWHACLQGDAKAWDKMRIYNNQDVELLTKLYEKFLPYIRNHPNLGDITRVDGACPKCGKTDLDKRGFNDARIPKQRYRCKNCGGWCNETTINKAGRTVNA